MLTADHHNVSAVPVWGSIPLRDHYTLHNDGELDTTIKMVREQIEIWHKPLMTRKEFFAKWTTPRSEIAYNNYFVYHTVYNRDGFECQVVDCTFHDSPLTIHHYRHLSNGGKTTVRNCVTICRAHQNKYHCGRSALKFRETPELPGHIRKATQVLDVCVNGKPVRVTLMSRQERRDMRAKRKQYKEHWGHWLNFEEIFILFLYLFREEPYASVS
jgi:5-methylcytosine-specific restriction endonuclease McrA